MIEILPGVFVTPAKAIEIHASLGRVITSHLDPEPGVKEPPAILADVLDVWPVGVAKASSEMIARLLAESSDLYAGWQGADVSRALRPYRRQVWINGRNVKGFWLRDLEQAS